MEPMVNPEPASLSPEHGEGQGCTPGSRGTPVIVVIVLGVAQGQGQAGLALRVLLLTLPGGTVLEEVRDVVDLGKINEKEGFGDPAARPSGSPAEHQEHGGHSQ